MDRFFLKVDDLMVAFNFGENWQAFSERHLDTRQLDVAVRSLQNLLEQDSLRGQSFLDVGCGSGLFSIAAAVLGAEKVVGVDINPLCVSVSQNNFQKLAPHLRATFEQCSALDSDELHLLGTFDIVYSWGVLHHTGSMWEAIQAVADMVSPGGRFILAIYNKHVTSLFWRVIKRFYNQVPEIGKRIMALFFGGVIYVAKFLVTGRNPLHKERGMNFWYDVIDWIGGYPYEYATPQEIQTFVEKLGFRQVGFIPAGVPTGCNEYTFERIV